MDSHDPEYLIVPGTVKGFPPVEKIYVEGKWVGMVYREAKQTADTDEVWIAYTSGGRGAASREEAIGAVLQNARLNPNFEVR